MRFDFSRFSFFKQKKVWLPTVAIATILLALAPLGVARASWYSQLAASIPSIFITLILQALLGLSQVALELANALLKWSAGGGPFAFSATNPASNPIISLGWTLLRDVTNTFFIIGLAYIGLMTALNLGSFDTKKTFFRLLVIALFINFSPVVCGVIVDFANLISGYFLTGVDFSMLINTFSMQRELIWKHSLDIITNGAIMLQVLMLIGFGAISAGIIFLFAALFFVRFPALWILVILSPLMFFFWVFDQTKKYFKDWWGQFLQWSFIVLPASFFIYLAQHTIVLSQQMLGKQLEGQNPGGSVFTSISPFFAGIVFLIFGLIYALKINASGAGSIMKAAQNVKSKATDYGKTALKAPVKYAAVGAGVGAVAAAKGVRNLYQMKHQPPPKPGDPGYENWAKEHQISAGARRAGRYLFGGETDQEHEQWKGGGQRFLRGLARTGAGVATLGGTVWGRRASRKINAVAEESTTADINKRVGELTGKTVATQQAAFRNAVTKKSKIAALVAAAKDDNVEDLGASNYEIKETLKDALKTAPGMMAGTLKYIDPRLLSEVMEEMKKTDAQTLDAIQQKVEAIALSPDEQQTVTQLRNEVKEIDANMAALAGAEGLSPETHNELQAQKDQIAQQIETLTAKVQEVKNASPDKEIEKLRDQLAIEQSKASSSLVGPEAERSKREAQAKAAEIEQQIAEKEAGKTEIEEKKKQIAAINEAQNSSQLSERRLKEAGVFVKGYNKETGELEKGSDLDKYAGLLRIYIDKDGKKQTERISALAAKIVGEIKTSKIDNWTKDVAIWATETEAAHMFWTGAQVGKAGEKFGSKFIKAFQESIPRITGSRTEKGQEKWYRDHDNAALANYLSKSSAAKNLGVSLGQTATKQTKAMLDELVGLHADLRKIESQLRNTELKDDDKKLLERERDDLKQKISEKEANMQATEQDAPEPMHYSVNEVVNFNLNQVKDILANGTDAQQEALQKVYENNFDDLDAQMKQYVSKGDEANAVRIAQIMEEIRQSLENKP